MERDASRVLLTHWVSSQYLHPSATGLVSTHSEPPVPLFTAAVNWLWINVKHHIVWSLLCLCGTAEMQLCLASAWCLPSFKATALPISSSFPSLPTSRCDKRAWFHAEISNKVCMKTKSSSQVQLRQKKKRGKKRTGPFSFSADHDKKQGGSCRGGRMALPAVGTSAPTCWGKL